MTKVDTSSADYWKFESHLLILMEQGGPGIFFCLIAHQSVFLFVLNVFFL